MSEMGSETPETGADRLNAALVAFVGCIGEAMPDLCSYGLTVGERYIPFNPDEESDCDEDEAACSQAWVRVMGVAPNSTEGWGGDCATVLSLDLEVGVIRCFEVPEGGEAPGSTDVLIAALQAMDDMNAILCAAMDCEVWESIESGQWVPFGPLGGQHGGTWTFTVEV